MSRRSKAPEVEEALRFPCLQTVAPAPAATKQAIVETFSAPSWRFFPPPVPTMSIVLSGTFKGSATASIARTNPVVSSTVSPFIFIAIKKAAI